MRWDKLLSAKRLGSSNSNISNQDYARTQFQRDYDRIIFSSPFRRLQNKTQVFPLPGSVFVHNRLTHSLEVASIGRSLGNMLSQKLPVLDNIDNNPFINELGNIVSAACLAHDLGNPPFGHSGEKAISRYFQQEKEIKLRKYFTEKQWLDLTNFEGNANAFRVLTQKFNGRRNGGFALTYTTLASLVKYPYGSDAINKKPKYGYFVSEKDIYTFIANELGIIKNSSDPLKFVRHPLVYLVEAADDIAYQVMDLEDAHKLKILTYDETSSLLTGFFDKNEDNNFHQSLNSVFKEVTDLNEQIAYLRASVINKLANNCIDAFCDNYDAIMNGEFTGSLTDKLKGVSKEAMQTVKNISVKKIYNHSSVVEIELAGYNVLGTLLHEFMHAAVTGDYYSEKLLSLLPKQFSFEQTDNIYNKTQAIVDFISGMTDLYAIDLYRKIKGIGPVSL